MDSYAWLSALEREFNRAFVETDFIISSIPGADSTGTTSPPPPPQTNGHATSKKSTATSSPKPTITPNEAHQLRQKISLMSSAFAQLCHKSLTVFQTNTKLQAILVDTKTDLVEAKSQLNAQTDTSPTPILPSKASLIQAQLDVALAENKRLRSSVVSLSAQNQAARLTALSLQGELAGRVQQLQLMARGGGITGSENLWRHIESEVYLHRTKAVLEALVPPPTRSSENGIGADQSSSQLALDASQSRLVVQSTTSDDIYTSETTALPDSVHGTSEVSSNSSPTPSVRTVTLRNESPLGLALTGGRQHGLPVLISGIMKSGPAHDPVEGNLAIGDAVLKVEETDTSGASHEEVVGALERLLSAPQEDRLKNITLTVLKMDDMAEFLPLEAVEQKKLQEETSSNGQHEACENGENSESQQQQPPSLCTVTRIQDLELDSTFSSTTPCFSHTS